jgi:uncharacterized SAM-binding protein YcdF (DUF218 family)
MDNFLAALTRPAGLLILLIGLALVSLWRSREKRRRLLLLTLLFVTLVAISLPAVGFLAVGSLEWQYPPQDERHEDVEAIVVLGGGVLAPDRFREQAELDSTSIYRCLQAVKLYRQRKPCLVLASGGKPDPTTPGPACADLMAELLAQGGVAAADLIVENTSRTTHENAVESAKILRDRQLLRVMLVTEAVHLPRAVLCFRKQGFEVIPSGCHYQKTEFKAKLEDFLPSVAGMADCESASHEWFGMGWYWLNGRI